MTSKLRQAALESGSANASSHQSPGIGTCWLGALPIFGFGDGRLVINGKTHRAHQNGMLGLAACLRTNTIFTCGEDGQVFATNSDGKSTVLFDDNKAWLDGLIVHEPSHRVAVSTSRDVLVLDWTCPNHAPVIFKPAKAPTAMAFSGDGIFLAIAHSGGVSLFKTQQPDSVWQEFPCTGGPLSVALDQSGAFLFAGLSEPALAGWRLTDGQGFRMGGYPGKPRQLVWSSNGKALLTTGGPALLIWPMIGKDGNTVTGPMGQAAGVYRPRLGMMTAVATIGDYAVTGWSDGGVDLVNLTDATTRHLGGPRAPKDLDKDPRALTAGIVSVALRHDGKQASWISETGAYGTAAVQ